ncbi:MAG: dimethylsulfonioproprionate lyase family protein [Pseudomonadota bacterium]
MTSEMQFKSTAAVTVDAMTATIDRLAKKDPVLKPLSDGLRDIDTDGPMNGPQRHIHPIAFAHLEQIAKQLPHTGLALAEIAQRAILNLDWTNLCEGGIDDDLRDGLFIAQAAGNFAGFESNEISVGLFLLGPNVYYPPHTHEPAEIYYCVSGEVEIQHGIGGALHKLKPGDYSYTPPNRLHSITTNDTPALLAYSWRGDLNAKAWWWEQCNDGSYQRFAWQRNDTGAWVRQHTEVVTDAVYAEATASWR